MRSQKIPEWYAFSTRVKHEKKVIENMQYAGFESFLPLRKTLNRWKDREKWVETPLFPSYVFTKIPFYQRYDVLRIPSVLKIVGFNNVPSPVRPDEIEAIRSLLQTDSQFDIVARLAVGSRVEICNGPLKGVEAHVSQIRGNDKVVINVTVLGKSIVLNANDYELKVLPN